MTSGAPARGSCAGALTRTIARGSCAGGLISGATARGSSVGSSGTIALGSCAGALTSVQGSCAGALTSGACSTPCMCCVDGTDSGRESEGTGADTEGVGGT